jgi:hypothetical protein
VPDFDDQFDAIARDLAEVGDRVQAHCLETADRLVADAMRLIRATAPEGLPASHAWLGAVQIVTEFAHRAAHEGMETEQ